ncbi:hypothetical protein B4U80_12788 [Leptotrombidium deliense]|uniref:Acetylserotonin O-methyltransferase n=1 Tax=Leptotrombidium deliense TaxID=299467 RepID=A0A443SLZ0_9ACAR|nr:hypothetical protein B4U80_12788 [Leptotrombidium deliense]
MAIGHWKSAFLTCAAKLGIADILQEQPMTAEELAKRTNTHPQSLFRLMRALKSMGLFEQNIENKFELTPLGSTLRTGIFRHVIITVSGDEYEPWTNLMHCIKTGEDGYRHKYGIGYYDHLKEVSSQPDNEEFHNFRLACHESTMSFNSNFTKFYDFTQFKHIIDCGGNDGTFLSLVLKSAPNAKGTVYDEAPAIAEAMKNIERQGLSHRMTGIAGSFVDSVPEGGDCYIMKSVFMDWIGESATSILMNIRARMNSDTKLLLILSVVPENGPVHPGKYFDIYYLLFTGGVERTRTELEETLKTAGLKINKIVPTDYPIYDIVEIVLDI